MNDDCFDRSTGYEYVCSKPNAMRFHFLTVTVMISQDPKAGWKIVATPQQWPFAKPSTIRGFPRKNTSLRNRFVSSSQGKNSASTAAKSRGKWATESRELLRIGYSAQMMIRFLEHRHYGDDNALLGSVDTTVSCFRFWEGKKGKMRLCKPTARGTTVCIERQMNWNFLERLLKGTYKRGLIFM